jgi:2-methylcitrate dehydratase PrpD
MEQHMSLTEELITFSVQTQYESLPMSVRHAASRCVLDHLGCVFGGMQTHLGRITADLVGRDGGALQATLVASGGKRVPAVAAALANGTAANALDYDDTLAGHPGCTVISAALAAAEYANKGGPDLLTSITIGYDVCTRIISFWQPIGGRYRRVWDTATLETFGAVAAVGHLLDLDREQMNSAFGIAAATAPLPRVRQPAGDAVGFRPMLKSTWGWASEAGIRAALLAQAGMTGQPNALDGESLVWQQSTADCFDLKAPEDRLGEIYLIERIEFKPYPACRFLHSTLDALTELIDTYAIDWRNIEDIEVASVDLLGDPYHYIPEPTSHSEAQFSTPFCVAALLVHGKLTPNAFTSEELINRDVLSLARNVKVTIEPKYQDAFPNELGSQVRIRSLSGDEWIASCNHPRGGTSNPLDDRQLISKFVDLVSVRFPLSEAGLIAEKILNIEREKEISSLMSMLG